MRIRQVQFTQNYVWEVEVNQAEVNLISNLRQNPPVIKVGARRLAIDFYNYHNSTIKQVVLVCPPSATLPVVFVTNKPQIDLYDSESYRNAVLEVFSGLKPVKAVHPENIPIDQVLFDCGPFSYILAPLDDPTKLTFSILKQNSDFSFSDSFFLPITNRGYPLLTDKEFSLRGEDKSKDFDSSIIEFKTEVEANRFRQTFNENINKCLRMPLSWVQEGDTWYMK